MFRGRLIRQGALCLAGVLLAGSFSIPTFAANDNSHIIRANGGYDPASYPAKTLDASFTQESIVLDGVLEDAYHNASSSKIQNVKPVDSYVYPEGGETSGELYALWDGPNLYLGIEVTDASVVKESEYKSKGAVGDNPAIPSKKVLTGYMEWFGFQFPQYSNVPDMDSVEIGIDLFHDQTVYETDTKGIVTVDAAGNFYYFRNSNIPSLGCPLADPQHPEYRDLIKGYAVSDRLDEDGNVIGYTVEIAFHIEETAMTNGTEIGVDIKINDASEVLDHYETVEVPNPDYIPSVSENDPVSGNDPTDPVSDNDPANPAGTTSDNDPVNPAGTTSDNDPVGSSDPDSGDPSDNGSNNQADPDANNGANNQADPDADNGSNGQTDPGADNGSNNQADPDADNGSNGQADPDADNGSNSQTDPDADNGSNNQADPNADNGSNGQADPDADNGSNSQTDPDAGNSSGDQPMAGNDTLSEVSGNDPDQEDVINTTDPTISVEQPVYVVKHLSSIFWSHDQDSVYTSFDHEHANSIDWGSVTLRNWNGEAFAYSNWLLQKTMNYLNSASFQKGVYTADSQAALEIAMNNAQVYLSSTSQIPSATKTATDQLLTAVKNLRWADTRYPDPADLPVQTTLPNPYQFFQSSRMVKTAADWKDRRDQILDLAQFYEYGYKPSYDTVEVIGVSPFKKGEKDSSSMWGSSYSCDGSRITLKVTANERSTYMSFQLYSTSQEAKEAAGHGDQKAPVVLSFDGDIAAYRNAGISVIGLPSVCSDTRTNDYAWNHRNGSFYDLYPYSRNGEAALKEVSNEMASAWGASVVIDALEQMAEDKNDVVADLAVDQLAVTGFSINGKYAFVSAVFDDRIDVCIPGAAGATGPSPWRYVYTGQEYDWSGTIYASTDPSVSNAQYAWGTELMANSIRHNRVRETELFRHFLTPGH
ncbi:MAG: hypothetical protein K5682_05610, partial [Lachnospiraceae bacterium]|nr:hypothetical protein [Lachnospiraceae bacterium]